MSVPYIADFLIRDVRRDTRIPDGNAALSDAEILRIADQEYTRKLMPALEGVYKNHHYRETDVAITKGERFYRIPSRATANGVRAVHLLDTQGNECLMEEMSLHSAIRRGSRNYAYQWVGGGIRFTADPPEGYTLRWAYTLRPGAFAKLGEDSAEITAIAGSTVTLSTVPASFTASEFVDTISGRDPFLFADIDLTIQSVAGSDVTLSAAPTLTAEGDYLTLAQQTPFFQGPFEAAAVLQKFTCAKVLDVLGYQSAYKRMIADAFVDLEAFKMRIAKRSDDARPGRQNPNSAYRSGRRTRGAY